jgi:hypothetical protein
MLKKDNESKHFLENNPQIISQEAYNYLKDWTTVVHYLGAKVYYNTGRKHPLKIYLMTKILTNIFDFVDQLINIPKIIS